MFNHEPANYVCPFCLVINGVENERVQTKQADIVYRDDLITAFIASCWWGINKGHVIIVPNKHFENIYDLPAEYSHRVHDFEKELAIALKHTYLCDGVSSRQHNEPAGNQDVWHYHLHVFPRYNGDDLYHSTRAFADPVERTIFANRLKEYFNKTDA
jgi:histidine triad (HIT) family protein